MSKLSLKNKHDVPKIDKIILNMGLGEDASDGKKLKACAEDLALISGQKPVITKFKKVTPRDYEKALEKLNKKHEVLIK